MLVCPGFNPYCNYILTRAILEPTGVNYSQLWIKHLEQAGVEVRLVDHSQLSTYRNFLSLPDKDDSADALALACYGFDYLSIPRKFLVIKDPIISQIRDKVFRLNYYTRLRNPIINRIKQDLSWQFPEVVSYQSKRLWQGNPPLLWRWIAEIGASSRYEKLYKNSCGFGLQHETRMSAKILCSIYALEQDIENDIGTMMTDNRFIPYLQVFENFGFGPRVSALLLSQIYPIQKFYNFDGSPEIVQEIGKVSGKLTKRYLSLRRFKKSLGVAPERHDWGR